MQIHRSALVTGLLLTTAVVAGCGQDAAPSAVRPSVEPATSGAPASGPVSTPAALVGTWAGVLAAPPDQRSRITLTLKECEGFDCGSIELRDAADVGCPYLLELADPARGQAVVLEPEPDETVYRVVNGGSADCEDSWLANAALFIRPAVDGGVEISRVVDTTRDPTFVLGPNEPNGPPGAPTYPFVQIDATEVSPGGEVVLLIKGFAAGREVSISVWPESGDIFNVGAATVGTTGMTVAPIRLPSDLPPGPATLWVDGFDRDLRETGVPIDVTVAPK